MPSSGLDWRPPRLAFHPLQRSARLLAGLSLLLGTEVASAESRPEKFRLEYAVGPHVRGCPSAKDLEREVARRLGHDPFSESASRIIHVTVRALGSSLRADLTLGTGSRIAAGQRTLVARLTSCRQLLASVALAITLATELESEGARVVAAKPRREPDAPPESQPLPARPTPAQARPAVPSRVVMMEMELQEAPQPRPASAFRALLGGHAAAGLSPTLATGLLAQLGIRSGQYSLGVEAQYDFTGWLRLPGGTQMGGSVAGVSLVPCWHRKLSLAMFCARAMAGRLESWASAGESSTRISEFVGTLGLRVGIEVPLGTGLFLTADTGVDWVLTPQRLVLDGAEVWSSHAVVAGFGLGGLLEFD